MNRKEYILIAEVLREARENELEALKFDYTEDDIRPAMQTIAYLEDKFVDRFRDEYPNFDELKFRKECKA